MGQDATVTPPPVVISVAHAGVCVCVCVCVCLFPCLQFVLQTQVIDTPAISGSEALELVKEVHHYLTEGEEVLEKDTRAIQVQ